MRLSLAFIILFLALPSLTMAQHHRKIFTPAATLAFVQACKGQTGSGTSWSLKIDSSGTCSASANPVAGDLVVLYLGSNSNLGGASCADTLINSWTNHYDSTNQEFYCYSILTTGGADTITTTSSFNGNNTLLSEEFSGPSATPLDGSAVFNGIGAGTSWSLPSITTTNAKDVVIACGTNHTAAVTLSWTAGSGFTIPTDGQNAATTNSGFCEYQIVSTATTYSPTATAGSAQDGKGMSIAFKSL